MRRIYTISLFALLTATSPAILAANSSNNNSTDNNSNSPAASVNNSATQSANQYGMSFEQLKKAAAQGDPDAEYALGYMYYYGNNGAPRDEPSARMWIQKAAAQGQPQAIKAVQLLRLAENPKQGNTAIKPPVDHLAEAARSEPPSQPAVAPKTPAQVSAASVDETRLLKEPSHYYTVQLMGSFNRADVSNFVKAHQLQSKAAIYKTYFHDKAWYVLVYGIYHTDAEAEEAIKAFPSNIRKLSPWVKSLSSVQEGIKKGQVKVANNQ